MKILKAVTPLKCNLNQAKLAEFIKQINERPFVELTESDVSGKGFVKPFDGDGAGDDLVVEFAASKGYAIALRYDEKIVPSSVVNTESKKRAIEIEAKQGYKPGRKQMKEIKETVFDELKVRALSQTKVIEAYCLIEPGEEYAVLLVASTSESMIDLLAKSLHQGCGIDILSINPGDISRKLSSRMTAYLDSETRDESFDEFAVGSRCKLRGTNGERLSFDLTESLATAKNGLTEALGSGALVSEIELISGDIKFRLSEGFRLKGVSLPVVIEEGQEFDSQIDFWKCEVETQSIMVIGLVRELTGLLGD